MKIRSSILRAKPTTLLATGFFMLLLGCITSSSPTEVKEWSVDNVIYIASSVLFSGGLLMVLLAILKMIFLRVVFRRRRLKDEGGR
jgi:hypothetical protein